ncbi:DUF397 domain-containing protein [Streptomyces sp. NPDC047725]|uniref:DUF397 domain-containing protein n=1 Tax=Streptomyces sp. NPDC047725 TaxID=3365487 RepID=UPI00370F8386
MTTLHWFKSSYSSNEGPDCVEVAIAPAEATVHVRDSKAPDDGRLSFTGAAWDTFLGFATQR